MIQLEQFSAFNKEQLNLRQKRKGTNHMKDNLQEIYTVSVTDTLFEAAEKMGDLHAGTVVIMKRDHEKEVPVGIITDREIKAGNIYVGDTLAPAFITAKITQSFSDILSLMNLHGIKKIPLVGLKNELAGVISAAEIIAALTRLPNH